MPFNGSGIFQRVRNWVNDATAGIKIRADYHDAEDDNLAAGLSNTITRDGQSQILQNIPWNSKRITGLADPVNPQDASTKAYADTKLASGSGGGTMTGDMTVTKDAPTLVLNSTGNGGSNLQGQKNGKMRWLMRLGNDTSETGANAGSDFDLHRYDDAGNYIGPALTINRADNVMNVSGPLRVPGEIYVGYNNTHATIRFGGTDSGRYLHWNGAQWVLNGGKLTLGGQGASGNDAVTVDQLNTKQGALGFWPVQQGGGAYQAGSKIYIGWDGGGLRAQVDGTDLGRFYMGGAPSAPLTDIHLDMCADVLYQYSNVEPHPGALMVGSQGGTYRVRWLRMLYNGAWTTVGTYG